MLESVLFIDRNHLAHEVALWDWGRGRLPHSIKSYNRFLLEIDGYFLFMMQCFCYDALVGLMCNVV